MKNKLICKKIMSIILIVILLLSVKVYAANDSFNTTIRVSNSQAKREDTITVTIGLENIAIESGEKGIGGYTASIKFDTSVLEYVSTNSTDKWEAPFYQNGLITAVTKDGEVVKTAQDIGTITFKVKKDAKLGESTIQLTNFSGTTVANDVVTADKSIKISIIDNNSDNNNDNNNNNSNNNNNDNSNNNSNNNNNNDNSNNNSNNNNNNDNSNNNSNNNNNNDNSNNNSNNNNNNSNNSNNSSNNNNDNKNNNISNSNNSNMNNEKNENIATGVLPKTGQSGILLIIGMGIAIICSIVLGIKIHKISKI